MKFKIKGILPDQIDSVNFLLSKTNILHMQYKECNHYFIEYNQENEKEIKIIKNVENYIKFINHSYINCCHEK